MKFSYDDIDEKVMKISVIIGMIFPGSLSFKRLVLLLIVCIPLGVQAQIFPDYRSSYNQNLGIQVYDEVDEWPQYDCEQDGIGLSRTFIKEFIFHRLPGEMFPSHIVTELIIDHNGVLVSIVILHPKEKDRLNTAIVDYLYSCKKWTPGKIKGAPVNTRIIMPFNVCFRE